MLQSLSDGRGDDLRCISFTWSSGASLPPYNDLNIGLNAGDEREAGKGIGATPQIGFFQQNHICFYFFFMSISTLLFFCRPSGLSNPSELALGATGRVSP
jgi:hypothetical protein